MKYITESLKELSPELAQQFGKLKAKLTELKSEADEVIPRIKKLIQEADTDEVSITKSEGTNGKVKTYIYGPKSSPYRICLTEFQQTDVKWKEEFKALYEKENGKGSFEKYCTKLDLKDADKLEVDVNPDYKGR